MLDVTALANEAYVLSQSFKRHDHYDFRKPPHKMILMALNYNQMLAVINSQNFPIIS